MRFSVFPMALGILCAIAAIASPPQLDISIQRPQGPVARWQVNVPPVVGAQAEYQLLASSNLLHWLPAGEPIKANESGDVVSPLETGGGPARQFFRLERNVHFGEVQNAGAEASGFSGLFTAELRSLGELPLEEFARLYPAPSNYLEGISFDPTTAEFWDDWNADPAVYNASLDPTNKELRAWDFRLNEQELATFKKLGFVVSERLATDSVGEMMYRIYNDDLPVFVSADAILQAWHRTYGSMLQELEETYFYNEWLAILTGMAEAIPQLQQAHGSGLLAPGILDADYYVTVALSLGRGTNVSSQLGQDARVTRTLDQMERDEVVEFSLFGTCRRFDFSQFRPRGHYTESQFLARYFRMVMWLGRTEFRITPAKADIACNENDPHREMAASGLLYFLLKESGGYEAWSQMNAAINVFVGEPDSMNFAQLGTLLKSAGIESVADLEYPENFARLNEMLLAGDFGVQAIMSDAYDRPGGKLPRTFTVFGQRFVPDSWALGKVVFDNIRWNGTNVFRRVPASLDVAFGALGNSAVSPLIIDGIEESELPYQHNLTAVRRTIDAQEGGFWEANIYSHWLGSLRALSAPMTDAKFPQAMRTRAWGMKTVNTQLASWTQLRHDTVLYAKQSYSGIIICSYPKAYVEPVLAFWVAMKNMAAAAANSIEQLELEPRQIGYTRRSIDEQDWGLPVFYDSRVAQSNQVAHLRRFSERMAMLEDVVKRQLEHQPLTEEQVQDLRDIVEIEKRYEGRRFTGWYPGLFYRNCFFQSPGRDYSFHRDQGCDRADFLVTDVHTAPPNPGPGAVLHQAVGRMNLLLIAVDCGDERPVVYGGPVLSHYEFATEGMNRMTDPEWAQRMHWASPPVTTPWTSEYLVPR